VDDLWVNPKTKTKKKNYGSGSRWQVTHYVERPDGTRAMRSKKFPTKSLADEFRARTEHDLRAGSYISPDLANTTFRDVAETWFSGRRKPAGSSLSKYRDALDVWVLPQWGNRKVASITKTEASEWVTALENGSAPHGEGRRVRGSGLGPAAVRAVWVPFQAVCAEALSLGLVRKNPATGVEMPKAAGEKKVYLNYIELEALIAAAGAVAQNPSDSTAVALMGYCGLRPGEVAALQILHVDLDSHRIKIRRTVTIDADRKPIIGGPKAGERRDVPIAPHLIEPLRELIGERVATDFLVTSVQGSQISLHNWRSRVWPKALAASKLDERDLVPQGLRHTAASMAIAAGADVKVVQAMLGHRDATVTLNTYADLWPDRLDEVSTKVSDARKKALSAAAKSKPS
jgi:integrase